VNERLIGCEFSSQKDRMSISERFFLFDKVELRPVRARGSPVPRFIARGDDQADLFGACFHGFFQDDLKCLLLDAIPIDEVLKRDSSLIPSSSRDYRFAKIHTDGTKWN
jgi:hypothetical protein